jgi:ATP-dependent helicase HrpB
MANPSPELPIHGSLPQIIDSLTKSGQVVIAAPPGAGKTTGVPPAILDAFPQGGKILLLQPRRMAARSVAGRLAQLQSTMLGEGVGYQVRMDRRWGKQTKIVVMTYGVLLRRLQSDPLLDEFGTVLLDEFHERSLEADLTLGMLARIRSVFRSDLRLGVMSATLDAGPVAQFLGDAPVVETAGRTYPLEIQYLDRMSKDRVEDQVANILPMVLGKTRGHVLVFLPGVGEIRRTAKSIVSLSAMRHVELAELYGDLSPERQDAVLQDTGKRKVILATNVAETSITIPGVTGVIDSGLARVLRMNPSVGLPRLDLEPVSQASAKQRAGRAGRTEPGYCFRLWMKAVDRARPEYDAPEILRGDLAGAVLQLYGWGETDVLGFPWLTPPRPDAIQAAELLLERLGAIEGGKITELGRNMLSIPAHPRLAAMLLAGQEQGIARRTAVCAAMLAERDPFIDSVSGPRISKNQSAMLGLDHADVVRRAERLEYWIDGKEDAAIQRIAGLTVKRAAQQLFDSLSSPKNVTPSDPPMDPEFINAAMAKALIQAFPDRLARLRRAGDDRGVMVGGQGVRFKQPTTVGKDLYLCIELLQKTTEADVRLTTPIEFEWLPERMLKQVDECFFHPTQRRVVGRRRLYWLDLVLTENPIEVQDNQQAAAILISEIRGRWERAFPSDDAELAQWVSRVRALRLVVADSPFPDIDQEWLVQLAHEICQGKRSIEEVRGAGWLDFVKAKLGYELSNRLDTLMPKTMAVPSGNMIAIDYANTNQPSLSVRLQELFGWTETPRIAGGRLPLLLRILAPNHREIQVTQDLASFWNSAYHEVRKELRRRYPKHHWPEDPLAATATKSGLGRHAKKDETT